MIQHGAAVEKRRKALRGASLLAVCRVLHREDGVFKGAGNADKKGSESSKKKGETPR